MGSLAWTSRVFSGAQPLEVVAPSLVLLPVVLLLPFQDPRNEMALRAFKPGTFMHGRQPCQNLQEPIHSHEQRDVLCRQPHRRQDNDHGDQAGLWNAGSPDAGCGGGDAARNTRDTLTPRNVMRVYQHVHKILHQGKRQSGTVVIGAPVVHLHFHHQSAILHTIVPHLLIRANDLKGKELLAMGSVLSMAMWERTEA